MIDFYNIESLFKSLIDWNKEIDKRYIKIHSEHEKVNYLRSLAISSLIKEVAEIFIQNEQDIVTGKLEEPLLDLLPDELQNNLKNIIKTSINKIYQSDTVLRIEAAGMKVLPNLLHSFIEAVMHPKKHKQLYKLIPEQYRTGDSDYEKILNIAMFISNMTDRQAVTMFRNINGITLAGY